MDRFKEHLAAIWGVLYNWREIWLWPLIAYLNLKLLCLVSYLTTGYWPQESLDALVGLGMNVLLITLAISATSILRESTGKWWTTEEMKASPHILWSATFAKVVTFIAILWALKF